MAFLIPSVIWAALVFWLIARAVGQRSGLPLLKSVPAQVSESLPYLTVVVPARDEAGNIGRCLAALLAQHYSRDSGRVTWKGRVYR